MTATLAWLAARNDGRIASATTLATMVDFTDVGEIGVFIDRDRLVALREHMKATGYLENHHLQDIMVAAFLGRRSESVIETKTFLHGTATLLSCSGSTAKGRSRDGAEAIPLKHRIDPMKPIHRALAAGASALALAAPALAQTAITPTAVTQSGDSYFIAAQTDLEEIIARQPNVREAKNVILFVGDGMSIPTITAARIYEGQQRGVDGESNNLAIDTFPYSALVEDLHARRAGRRLRADRDRDGHRRQDQQRRDRRRLRPSCRRTAPRSRATR